LEADRLFDEWVTHFPTTLRPRLNPRRFQVTSPDWWREARLEHGARWGGEVAATRLTGHLKPAAFTIYVEPQTADRAVAALARRHHLRADARGNVEILESFWTFDVEETEADIVPVPLVYADLMATLDPRNLDVAKQIRAQYVNRALRSA
jgi:hypothetical protein